MTLRSQACFQRAIGMSCRRPGRDGAGVVHQDVDVGEGGVQALALGILREVGGERLDAHLARARARVSAAAASAAASRDASTTSQPSAAKASAQARPMPFDPPVTSTRLP